MSTQKLHKEQESYMTALRYVKMIKKGVPEHFREHLYTKYAPGTYSYRFEVHSKHHLGTISEHMAPKSCSK